MAALESKKDDEEEEPRHIRTGELLAGGTAFSAPRRISRKENREINTKIPVTY